LSALPPIRSGRRRGESWPNSWVTTPSKEHDRKRRSPGKDRLHKLLGGAPTLILMDEVAEYVVKAKDFRDQVIAFFQELTETVKVLPQCVLVVTLPASAPYGEEGERALHQLQQVFKRVEAINTPVEGEEIYEIIRRRLFEDTPDPSEARKNADGYWEMYGRLGDDVPREVRETAYRDKLRKAYPFHPELIDLLFERWSTYSSFQRTRGVLRLLAEVVADLYTRQHPAPLIQPAHLNLANPPSAASCSNISATSTKASSLLTLPGQRQSAKDRSRDGLRICPL
jgi:predicted AAA+ superfamily ATPase